MYSIVRCRRPRRGLQSDPEGACPPTAPRRGSPAKRAGATCRVQNCISRSTVPLCFLMVLQIVTVLSTVNIPISSGWFCWARPLAGCPAGGCTRCGRIYGCQSTNPLHPPERFCAPMLGVGQKSLQEMVLITKGGVNPKLEVYRNLGDSVVACHCKYGKFTRRSSDEGTRGPF